MASSHTEYELDVDYISRMRKMFQRLDVMRREPRNCDLIISIEGKEIHTNKNVMCAASDYFDAMFSHDTIENQEGLVVMKEVSFASVNKCIDYIYTGKISISEEESEELMYSASLLQLHDICEKVTPFLKSRLNCDSFFNIRRIAGKFSMGALTELCNEFALSNFTSLSKQKHFSELEFDYLRVLFSPQKSTPFIEEDTKLATALEWIKAEPLKRETYLMEFVNLLDMTKISRDYCRLLAEKESLCQRSAEFMTKIVLILTAPAETAVAKDTRNQVDTVMYSSSSDALIMCDISNRYLQVYTPFNRKFKRMVGHSAMFDKNCCACILNKKLYVFSSEKQAFVLDHDWYQLDDMIFQHGDNLQCTTHENSIYVGGGNALEKLLTKEDDKWVPINLDGNVCDKACIIYYDFHDCVYVIGGYNLGESLETVMMYSPTKSIWHKVSSLNTGRYNASAAVLKHIIYVAGGISSSIKSFSFEMYDAFADCWTRLPKMSTRRSSFRLHPINDQIFAVGNGVGPCSIEVFDPSSEKWQNHECNLKSTIMGTSTVSFVHQTKHNR